MQLAAVLAALSVLGLALASSKLFIILAAVVIVVSIVIVFILVLRNDSSSDTKAARGLARDPDDGPAAQGFGDGSRRNNTPAGAWNGAQGGRAAFDSEALHRPGDFGGTVGSVNMNSGSPAAGRTPSRPQAAWDAAAQQQSGWNMPESAQWGQPQADQGWGQNPDAAWGAPRTPAAPQQPAWNAPGRSDSAGFGQPAADPWGQQPVAPQQPAWNAPPVQSPPSVPQRGWNDPQQPAWNTPPAQQDPWGQQPVAPQQPAWNAPQAPQQPAWNAPAAAPQQPAWNTPPAQQDPWGQQPAAPQQPAWNSPPADAGWRNGPPSQPMPPQGWGVAGDPAAARRNAPYDQQGAYPSAPAMRGDARVAYVIIRDGKEPGKAYDLRKDRMTMGRSRESDIFLEDLAVSRLHASIYRDEQGNYILRDENSANGTTVNGQRVTEHRLQEGDEIQVGQTTMTFTRR